MPRKKESARVVVPAPTARAATRKVEEVLDQSPRLPTKALVKERRSPRGLVPSSTYGCKDVPYNAYLDSLDPRGSSSKSEEVRFALASSSDVRFQAFLERLTLPHYSRYSLAALAKSCDIALPEFAQFWQSAQKQRALARAQDALPDLTEDLASDARTKLLPCERCDAFGFVRCDVVLPDVPGLRLLPGTTDIYIRTCPLCKGARYVPKTGDVDSRKLLLEMTGVTGKRAPVVSIQQNFGGVGLDSAQTRMSKVTFDLNPDDVVDVTPDPAA